MTVKRIMTDRGMIEVGKGGVYSIAVRGGIATVQSKYGGRYDVKVVRHSKLINDIKIDNTI